MQELDCLSVFWLFRQQIEEIVESERQLSQLFLKQSRRRIRRMWSLAGLEEMIMPRLSQLDGRLQREIIAIVSNNEPVATYDLTEALLVNRGFSSQEAKIIARSANWLAIVRRDKKEERGFERIADKLLTFLE